MCLIITTNRHTQAGHLCLHFQTGATGVNCRTVQHTLMCNVINIHIKDEISTAKRWPININHDHRSRTSQWTQSAHETKSTTHALSLIFVLPPALDNFGAVKERVINLKTIST